MHKPWGSHRQSKETGKVGLSRVLGEVWEALGQECMGRTGVVLSIVWLRRGPSQIIPGGLVGGHPLPVRLQGRGPRAPDPAERGGPRTPHSAGGCAVVLGMLLVL